MKQVVIKSTGAGFEALDTFVGLQGNLKTLSDENYEKLKRLILEFGFSDPIAVWISPDESFYILDGHQRVATLKRMRDEGYEIPYLPYNYVEAETEEEAKMKLLSITSQFGVITEKGLSEFVQGLELDVPDLETMFSLPDVDLSKLFMEVEDAKIPEDEIDKSLYSDEAKEKYDRATVKAITFNYDQNDYAHVVNRLNEMMEHFQTTDHAETLIRVLDGFHIIRKKAD